MRNYRACFETSKVTHTVKFSSHLSAIEYFLNLYKHKLWAVLVEGPGIEWFIIYVDPYQGSRYEVNIAGLDITY